MDRVLRAVCYCVLRAMHCVAVHLFLTCPCPCPCLCRHAEPVDEVQEAEAKVMYILTLGCREECRRQGLATVMVQRCLAHGREDPLCGAVYLHVVEYNEAALRFYEKNEFVSLRTLYSFYIIDGQAHTGMWCVMCGSIFVVVSMMQRVMILVIFSTPVSLPDLLLC